MPASRRILAVVAAAAAVLASAASADAAILTTTACVRTAEGVESTMPITGTGFTPGSSVTLRSSPSGVLTTAVTDAAGSFSATPAPPSFNPFGRKLQTFRITATDDANPAIVAATTYKQVLVSYSTSPATGRPTRRATHTVRGFFPGKNIYLHFRFNGQTKRNVRIGRANSPCGVASRRMPLLPTRSRPGTWSVYADQAAVYSKTTTPQLKYTFTITRTFG